MARGKSKNSSSNNSANIGFEAKLWLAADKLRNKDDDPRWQWSEATSTTSGSPKGEHNQAHQFASIPRGSANFAWVQHFIYHLAPAAPGSSGGMAGFVLVRFSFWLESKPTCAIKFSDKATPNGFRERRPALLFVDVNDGGAYLHSLN